MQMAEATLWRGELYDGHDGGDTIGTRDDGNMVLLHVFRHHRCST